MLEQLTEILIQRLEEKGLAPDQIHRFIRDVTNPFSDDHDIDLEERNRQLHLLGWEGIELDDHTFQLIRATLEAKSASKIT